MLWPLSARPCSELGYQYLPAPCFPSRLPQKLLCNLICVNSIIVGPPSLFRTSRASRLLCAVFSFSPHFLHRSDLSVPWHFRTWWSIADWSCEKWLSTSTRIIQSWSLLSRPACLSRISINGFLLSAFASRHSSSVVISCRSLHSTTDSWDRGLTLASSPSVTILDD